MSYTLMALQSGECFHFTIWDWSETLGLAISCGWNPSGTVLEGNPQWKGGYQSNDYQQVTAHDALKLSAALSIWLRKPSPNPKRREYIARFVDFARQSGGFKLS